MIPNIRPEKKSQKTMKTVKKISGYQESWGWGGKTGRMDGALRNFRAAKQYTTLYVCPNPQSI